MKLIFFLLRYYFNHLYFFTAVLATAAGSGARALYGNLGSTISYRDTYPDSCPIGVDMSSGTPVVSRLCLPNASAGKGWSPTYNMSMSTIIMPCNTSGWYNASLAAKFGLVDVDWSNAKKDWANKSPMDCEERLVAQKVVRSGERSTHFPL